MGFQNRQRIQVAKDGPNSRRLLALRREAAIRADRAEIVAAKSFATGRSSSTRADQTGCWIAPPERPTHLDGEYRPRLAASQEHLDREREFSLSRALRLVKQVIIVIRPRFASISSRSSFFTRRATRFDRRHANRRRETLVRPGLLFAHFAPRRYLAFRPGTIRRRQ